MYVPPMNVVSREGPPGSPYRQNPPSTPSSRSARPATAPIGSPAPSAFPYVARSGTTPKWSCAPRGWGRSPVSISSKSSTMPRRAVSSRSDRTNSTGRRPGLRHCTGSTSTAAIVSPRASIVSRASGAPYSSTISSATALAGMPRETGTACCPGPPGRPRTESMWPWYEPRNMTTLSRPVAARASRIAAEFASVPDEAKATRSVPVSEASRAAASPVSGERGPKRSPSARWRRTASVTGAASWPRSSAPKPMVMSV